MLDAEHTLRSGLGCCLAQRCHKSSTVDPGAALRAPNVRCQQHKLPPHTHLVHVLLTARPARTQVGGYFGVDSTTLINALMSSVLQTTKYCKVRNISVLKFSELIHFIMLANRTISVSGHIYI